MANDILKIIRGISQAVSNSHDGAYEKDGWTDFYDGSAREPVKIGLNRERFNNIDVDSRGGMMDGFGCFFHGNKLCIKYHGEVNMKDLHRGGPKNYENEIEQKFNDIAKHIKKEYKKHTGDNLKLTSDGDASSLIQRMNRMRNWVQSTKYYKIGNLTAGTVGDVDEPNEERSTEYRKEHGIDAAIKNFLSLSSKQNPKNRFVNKQPKRPGPGEIDKG